MAAPLRPIRVPMQGFLQANQMTARAGELRGANLLSGLNALGAGVRAGSQGILQQRRFDEEMQFREDQAKAQEDRFERSMEMREFELGAENTRLSARLSMDRAKTYNSVITNLQGQLSGKIPGTPEHNAISQQLNDVFAEQRSAVQRASSLVDGLQNGVTEVRKGERIAASGRPPAAVPAQAQPNPAVVSPKGLAEGRVGKPGVAEISARSRSLIEGEIVSLTNEYIAEEKMFPVDARNAAIAEVRRNYAASPTTQGWIDREYVLPARQAAQADSKTVKVSRDAAETTIKALFTELGDEGTRIGEAMAQKVRGVPPGMIAGTVENARKLAVEMRQKAEMKSKFDALPLKQQIMALEVEKARLEKEGASQQVRLVDARIRELERKTALEEGKAASIDAFVQGSVEVFNEKYPEMEWTPQMIRGAVESGWSLARMQADLSEPTANERQEAYDRRIGQLEASQDAKEQEMALFHTPAPDNERLAAAASDYLHGMREIAASSKQIEAFFTDEVERQRVKDAFVLGKQSALLSKIIKERDLPLLTVQLITEQLRTTTER